MSPQHLPHFSIGTFNLKDFFDEDAVFFRQRIEHLGELVKRTNVDVLALQEVGSESALWALAAYVGISDPACVVLGTADKRGIRNALLARIPPSEHRIHTRSSLGFPAFVVGDPAPFGDRIPLRRGIVHGVWETSLGRVHVLTAHFKSKLGVLLKDRDGNELVPTTPREFADTMLRSLVSRAAEGLLVRELVDEIRTTEPGAHVCVTGDLNDTVDSLPVRIVRGHGIHELHSATAGLAEAVRFSALFGGMKEQIDQLLITDSLRARMVEVSILNEHVRDHGPYDPNAAPTIDSDHAPVRATFV